ncbi:hypothetical protein N7931_01390 [Catenovulum sp. 2E275]|uniref:hypothetical protein n=1 Tax=Catenovulum sp. 2E275 TaxID=2980497 RepID=UPI0021D1BCA3|nr:hypothetical protein [Catenovulum sp. 2E275]MCU4674273.1 hypothetical protein [Catenovulum sp. 2E275]
MQIRLKPLLKSLSTFISLVSCSIHADTSNFQFNGFLTIAGYHGSSNQIGYKSSIASEQYSYRGQWIFDDLSLIGGQVNYTINSQWELIGQVVLKNELIDNELERIKIATINYRPDSSWLIRAGRFYPRGYLVSESRLIGYAHNDVLPVQDFYSQLPLPYVDGIDATYTYRSNYGLLSLNSYFGQTQVTFKVEDLGDVTGQFKNLFGINLEYEVENWLLRASYSQVEQMEEWQIVSQIEGFMQLLANPQALPIENNFTPWLEGLEIIEQTKEKGGIFKYLTLAAEYHQNNLRIRSELARLSSGTYLLPDTDTGYINFAYTMNEVTPFLSVSFIHSKKGYTLNSFPEDDFLDTLDQVSPVLQNTEGGSRFVLNVINDFIDPSYKQKSLILGMRWDFELWQAVKFQFERKWVEKNAAGLWQTERFSQNGSEQVDVFLISYDRMF